MSQMPAVLKGRDYDWGARLPTLDAGGATLRALSSRDVPALFEIFGDAEVARYWSRAAMPSLDVARELLEEIESGFEQRQLFQWGIARQDDQVMGTCTVFQLDHNHRRCEIGFALARKHWGQGIARRAVSSILGFCFDMLQLHRVEADADPRNKRSLRLLEGLGFVREGLLRERYQVGGEVQDAVLLGLLEPDWRSRQ